jgi:hypothetical protein
MPVISYLLSDFNHLERAVEILTMAEKRPFVTNSPLMQQVVCDPVREDAKRRTADDLVAAKERGQNLDSWDTAEALLSELRTLQE